MLMRGISPRFRGGYVRVKLLVVFVFVCFVLNRHHITNQHLKLYTFAWAVYIKLCKCNITHKTTSWRSISQS